MLNQFLAAHLCPHLGNSLIHLPFKFFQRDIFEGFSDTVKDLEPFLALPLVFGHSGHFLGRNN